ncbi:MAG: ArsR family transcriptional regulator [Thermoanaerobaculia bacterium]|nr:ArsR family transcriptional regulator [Thermoanaerobaculia bacterium]
MPEGVERIEVDRARRRVQSGEALLVCAYDDQEKCEDLALEGSISLDELREREVDDDRELIFYCA